MFFLVTGMILLRLAAAKVKEREEAGVVVEGVDAFSVLSMGAFILAAVVNSAAIYLSYKFSIGVVDLGGLFFQFAIYAAVIMTTFLSFYYMISTIKVLFFKEAAK